MNFTDIILYVSKNPLIIALLPSIVVSILTYIITKKNIKNERKISINQMSFDLVYLPLFRKFNIIESYDSLSDKDAKLLYLQLKTLYEKYIIYTNPTLKVLLNELKKRIDSSKNTHDIISRIHSHISDNYYRLRKKLHYPYMSFRDGFRYTSIYHKFFIVNVFILLLIYALFFILSFISYYKLDTEILKILIIITAVVLICYVFLLLFFITCFITDIIIKLGKNHRHKKSFKNK